jgi:hypothetical protein
MENESDETMGSPRGAVIEESLDKQDTYMLVVGA